MPQVLSFSFLFFPVYPPSYRPNTSSSKTTSTPPRASAQDGIGSSRADPASPVSSPFSTTSTADDGESSSPILPPLPAPKLPERALEYLRTPPQSRHNNIEEGQYATTSWGSPYPHADSNHHRRLSFSSEPSEDSPLHQLAINTPFLRPAPLVLTTDSERSHPSLSGSAAVLANRARRPPRGITEDWIRQHTTGDLTSEHHHWLSDGTDDSEHSSLSGSISGDDAGWSEETDPRTPRPTLRLASVSDHTLRRYPRNQSSNETLRQAIQNRRVASQSASMDSLDVDRGIQDAASIHTIDTVSEVAPRTDTPIKMDLPNLNGSAFGPSADLEPPMTPVKPKKAVVSQTPRLKKKVPWRGKNIMVLLPRDKEQGQPGNAPMPLDASQVETMLNSWEELGYNTRGFDLEGGRSLLDPDETNSQSRNEWPNQEDLTRERSQQPYQVTLPDLNAWRDYVNELQEAKLRALGVSFGDDEPAPPPSISPAMPNLSCQPSSQFQTMPFSPPLPTASAASNGPQGFPFPSAFLSNGASSGAQSPGIPSTASPVSFNGPPGHGRFNPRAGSMSMSISPHELPFNFSGQPSPRGWSPQMMLQQQQLGRNRSPSMLNMNSLVSPTSPFQRDGMSPPVNMHQRHQSLQYPMLPHQHLQRRDSARASPRLQELREDEEEINSNPPLKSPSKTPKPAQFIRHNASDSLQKEIDDAEYHLEEQFRSQLEHEDYSPHNENEKAEAHQPLNQPDNPTELHARGPSVHFGGFGTDSDEGPRLHHPQPHSRGHSLSQKAFFDNDEVRDSTDEGSVRKPQPQSLDSQKPDDSYEIETNPSNLGTPVQSFELMNQLHQRTLSTASNPWADVESLSNSNMPSRRASHASKPSFSKLNAGAAEFKFNPTSSFTPGQYVFGGNSARPSPFQPAGFQAPSFTPNPLSTTSSHFSVPSTSSSAMAKINAAAPTFSPRKGDFSFSASGPKFNPDAKAFQPLSSVPPSIASVGLSGNESADNRATSIFSNIDLSLSDIVKPVKKSKAIPIVRPSSRHSPAPAPAPVGTATSVVDGDQHGRVADTSRLRKKFRDNNDNGDDVPLFAEPTPEPEPMPQAQLRPATSEAGSEKADKLEDSDAPVTMNAEDELANLGDTTFASTTHSESTDGKLQSESNDTKATTSPSATSPDQDQTNWRPFEFRNDAEIMDFNNARPFGEDVPSFTRQHKKNSLSATAQPFVPGGFTFGAESSIDTPFEPILKTQPAQLTEPLDESEEDRAGSPTPMPELRPAALSESEPVTQQEASPSPKPAPAPPVKGLGFSRFASPPPAAKGLKASRFASSPSPPPQSANEVASPFAASPSPVSEVKATHPVAGNDVQRISKTPELHSYEPLPVSPPSDAGAQPKDEATHEPTFEEIDAVMDLLNHNDPTMGAKKTIDSPQWHHPSPVRRISVSGVTTSPPLDLPPQMPFRNDAPSPVTRQYRTLPQEAARPMPSTELEDPFLDPPQSAISQSFDAPIQRLNIGESLPESEWDDAFSESEQGKLEQRVQYFDGHVSDLVGNILSSRLDPLEHTLDTIQHALSSLSRRAPSSRRERRSVSAEIQESDADDEDDDAPIRRSTSPRRDKKMDQIRIAVMDAFNLQQTTRALQAAQLESVEEQAVKEDTAVLKALEEMREQFAQNLHLDFRAEDLRNIVEEAVERRMPPTPQPVIKDDEEANNKLSEMQSRILELEQRLRTEERRTESERSRVLDSEAKLRAAEDRSENETTIRRGAEDRTSELRRQLEQAETKVEVEIMNRSVFDQRIHDLEQRLGAQEHRTEFELAGRREAEDRLSETQRLLRISSEEEDRLRSVLDEREQKIKVIEQSSGKNNMRLALLEAAQTNGEQTQAELKNRLNIAEVELRDTRQEARHWRSEAEHARESAHRQADDLVQVVNENKHFHKLIDTLSVQLEENERIRDNWRAKFVSLQDDMAHAAREITEENSRRSKKEQALIARQEVLDAKLQAEARTRERLEVEVERLEGGERAGMRAVGELKRLEGIMLDLRNENHSLQQNALRAQREVQEARDAAASEVQRTRISVDAELEAANNQVNSVRSELEDDVIKIRAQLDQVRMDADTANAQHEMMLEAAQISQQTQLDEARAAKESEFEAIVRKHQNDIEDLQARYERQISNGAEDAQRAEQNLIERLSLSTSKTELLQDRVTHLEDKVQIAQEAAKAAAQAAAQASKGVVVPEHSVHHPTPVVQTTKQLAEAMQLPEKISPQALRESIMVLQEQLQAREQRIEELEQTVSKLDPDSATKISKRDDEITWLRELLAVRHGDLQDIIGALSVENFDSESVRDAAIRLKAGLQMEEQERERAMNGGSAINLPNIAATIQKAATPRVAQAVGPLAAAWGNWRKANQPVFRSSPAPGRNATPSKASPAPSQNSFLSGLMTPPASNVRNTPQAEHSQPQPTAFGNTGRRFTAEQFANRSRGPPMSSRQAEKMPIASTPPPRQEERNPQTPPMMRSGSYDADAQVEEFDDASFFDD
ncbi:Uu.00g116860.m01.CDS01 [Anthostomella pinea]|uniref:Uu.00g116860.m01.CDS01 n=1 Tax=Anthostomella pinea TaxID=933095 RepID=A0AAI8YH07_9PEZI|nr:Uu.00g116860.m01.CDS01 [Anthostomella pinea]